MPGGDRTGPNGAGTMTGRQLGYCNNYNSSGFAEYRNSFGRRRGCGRGYGRELYFNRPELPVIATMTKEEELSLLETQSKNLQNTLEKLNERIQKLENE